MNIIDKKDLKLISKNFRSNIMLAVTEVNGCIYCSYYHVKIALKSGTTKKVYGDKLAEGILSNIRLIMMGNAYGIAANCLKLRLTGKKVIGSKLINELSILTGIVVLFPILIIKNIFTKKID